MKYHPVTTSKFAKDYTRIKKQGKNLGKLKVIVEILVSGQKLPPKFHDHQLIGDCAGCRECQVEPDWLLMYEVQEEEIIFLRTGTHSDLFE